jgi:hypothetical protein
MTENNKNSMQARKIIGKEDAFTLLIRKFLDPLMWPHSNRQLKFIF